MHDRVRSCKDCLAALTAALTPCGSLAFIPATCCTACRTASIHGPHRSSRACSAAPRPSPCPPATGTTSKTYCWVAAPPRPQERCRSGRGVAEGPKPCRRPLPPSPCPAIVAAAVASQSHACHAWRRACHACLHGTVHASCHRACLHGTVPFGASPTAALWRTVAALWRTTVVLHFCGGCLYAGRAVQGFRGTC